MSQVITNAFEQYWQSSLAAEQPVVLDEFILADIPNLDITSPIDPDADLPPESQIVHRQNVDQRGRINNNAVAYTIVMDTTVGDFSFNAMYLRNKQNGVIGMIVYKGRETKLKTDQTTGQTGNSLVKSMLMGYDQAAEATLTNVDAGTWQIDYAARLRGMDEDIRQLQADLYGHHTFVGDGFKVVETDGAFQVTPGVAIVGGLRVELKQPEVIYPGTKPIGVWVDVHRAGSLLSEHQNHVTIITSVADLTDHVDNNGYQHFVAKLANISNGENVDLRAGDPKSVLLSGIQKTSTLKITSVEALVDALSHSRVIYVDNDITISTLVKIPASSEVVSIGGKVIVGSNDASIIITPNVKWLVDVVVGVYECNLFVVDGKESAPRWYLAEHDTLVKCKVSSSVSKGKCLSLLANSSKDVRALISGFKSEITLSKMEYALFSKVSIENYEGSETGNSYITNNEIKFRCAGTLRGIHEEYSGDGVTKNEREEIASNIIFIEHQPKEGVANYPLRVVGRSNNIHAILWDNHKAINSDQVVVYGNNNKIDGTLPALNSGYVQLFGLYISYYGETYGTPRTKVNNTEFERGAYHRSGEALISYGGVFSASSQSIPIKGASASTGVTIFRKRVTPKDNQLPAVVDVDLCSMMVNGHKYKVRFKVNNVFVDLESILDGGVVNFLRAVIDGDSISLSSQAGNSFSSISNSDYTGELDISVVVYSDSEVTECGYIRSHSAKIFFAGV